ncbi:MAG: SpoIIE family protein phosphatase [Bacteroidales bacterium]
MKRGIVLFFLVIFSQAVFYGQANRYGIPLHSSYSVELSGGSEYNHCITKDSNGIIYAGNDGRGVIRFDGKEWSLIPVRNNRLLNAIKADRNNIIYVGGVYEFGYIQPSANGDMAYVSLAERIDTIVNIRTVYSVLTFDDRVSFFANRGIFTYYPANDSLEVFDVEARGYRNLLTGISFDGKTIVSDNLSGLLEFTGDTIFQLPGGSFFSRKVATVILPFSSEELLIGTLTDGVFIYNVRTGDIKDSFISSELNESLKQGQIYRGVWIDNENFALGMRSAEGVVVINRSGELVNQYTSEFLDIDNDVVTALYSDPERSDELWICTVGFITKLYINLPFTVFSRSLGVLSGTNTVVEFNNTIYAGHDGGILKLVKSDQGFLNFSDLPDVPYYTPALMVFEKGDETFLMAGTERGMYVIDSRDRVYNVENTFPGGEKNPRDVRTLLQSKLDNSIVYAGTANAILMLKYLGNGRWENLLRYLKFQGHINQIVETSDGRLWLTADISTSLYGLKIEGNDTTLVEYDTNRGLPGRSGMKLRELDGDVLVTTPAGIYIYDNSSDSFKSADDRFDNFTANREISFLMRDSEGDLWINFKEGSRFIEAVLRAGGTRESFIYKPFSVLPTAPSYDIYEASDRVWLAKSKNVFVVDKKKLTQPEPEVAAFLNRIIIGGNDSVYMSHTFTKPGINGQLVPVLNQMAGDVAEFPYRFNDMKFYWSSNYYIEEDKTEYSYFLEGSDRNWSRWDNLLYKEYGNLKYGHYVFRVKARTVTGIESDEARFEFVIRRPWYATFIAILLYIVAAVGILLVIIKAYTRRLINENLRLEGIVAERTAEVVRQKEELESSIHYASRIQRALLPSEKILEENLKNYFILFKPRDIVSGDFFWMTRRSDKLFVVAADCTGHGVPGAFMSLLGMSFLDEIVNKSSIQKANIVLRELRYHVTNSLKQVGEDDEAKDGMDLALLIIDFAKGKIEFSGAYNPCFRIRKLTKAETDAWKKGIEPKEEGTMSNGKYILETIFATKMPIGISARMDDDFLLHEWALEKGVSYYLFSDGYVDQFGVNGRKFMKKNFKKLLLEIQDYPMKKQKDILEKTLSEWMGDTPQIDDILVLGLRTE